MLKYSADLIGTNFDIARESERVIMGTYHPFMNEPNPPSWSWVIGPKEHRLGQQTLVCSVTITDADDKDILQKSTYDKTVYVTDPLGLPAWAYYLATFLGVTLSAPFVVWFLSEWRTRAKEKRDEERRQNIRSNEPPKKQLYIPGEE